jgi:ADP-heptose:LPS heptosyltransferase
MSHSVVFLKQLGDLVLLQPTLSGLARASGAEVQLHCKEGLSPITTLMEGVHWRNALQADHLWCYERGSKAAWLSFRSRCREKNLIIAKDHEKRWFHPLIFKNIDIVNPAPFYRSRYYFDQTPPLQEQNYLLPTLQAPPETWGQGLDLPQNPWLLVHPTSAWRRKCWPVSSWVEALRYLHETFNVPLVLSGGLSEWEQEHCREIMELAEVPILDISGQTSLEQLLILIHGSAGVITVDGAVAHIASAFQRRYLVIFGPANPLHWFHPTAYGSCLSARDYSGEKRPSADKVPAHAVIETLKSWHEPTQEDVGATPDSIG